MSKRGNQEGSVYRRGSDGRWVASLTITDPSGKSRKVRRYSKSRDEARDALKTMRREQELGVQLGTKLPTLSGYLNEWLKAIEPSVRTKTHEGYESIVRKRISPHIGGVRLDKVTPVLIQGFYADLAASGLTNRSIVNTHRVLRRALDQAVKWNQLGFNPADGATPPRVARAEMQVLDRVQAETFLSSTAAHRDHGLYILALSTGMRLGECLGLKWSDIDFDVATLKVRRALQAQQGRGLMFVEPKTSRSRRTIHLSQRAMNALKRHRTRQLEERLKVELPWVDQDLVFPDSCGRPLSPSGTTKRFQTALRQGGLPTLRFHDLRHSAATLLLGAGVHPKVVSEMLGHTTISLTLDVYSHYVPSLHIEAAAAMDRMLGT